MVGWSRKSDLGSAVNFSGQGKFSSAYPTRFLNNLLTLNLLAEKSEQ